MQEMGSTQTSSITGSAQRLPKTSLLSQKNKCIGYHILLVDDDHLVRAGLGAALQAWGYQVSAAENIENALTKLSQIDSPVNLVIADYDLGQDNGIRLVTLVRAQAGTRLPCIIVTAHGDERTLSMIGQYDLPTLIKPLDMHRLKAEIIALLNKKS